MVSLFSGVLNWIYDGFPSCFDAAMAVLCVFLILRKLPGLAGMAEYMSLSAW